MQILSYLKEANPWTCAVAKQVILNESGLSHQSFDLMKD
jgi:hypothetical protein